MALDKLVFFFRHKDGLTREEFHRHYVEQHAPLGLRVTVTMAGYTVNLVDSESDVDAVTEIWTASMADFFDPSKSFATEADAKTLMADHNSFIGPYDAYAVEEEIVSGGLPDAPLGAVAPGAKVFVRYADAAAVPPPPGDALHVVDQRVVASVRDRNGGLIDSQKEVGGWPELKTLPPFYDGDNDGMPDHWERAHALDLAADDSAGDTDKDGYTNLEEYLNELVLPRPLPRITANGASYPTLREAVVALPATGG